MKKFHRFLGIFLMILASTVLAASLAFAQTEQQKNAGAKQGVSAKATPANAATKKNADAADEEADTVTTEIKLTPEQAAPLVKTTEGLIRDEIKTSGAFEVDDPDTGNLLNLQFASLDAEVVQVIEGEYLLKGNFTDKDNKKYGIGVYVEKLEDGSFEIVDAVVETIDGKPVFE